MSGYACEFRCLFFVKLQISEKGKTYQGSEDGSLGQKSSELRMDILLDKEVDEEVDEESSICGENMLEGYCDMHDITLSSKYEARDS